MLPMNRSNQDGNGEPVETYTIVTMDADGGMLNLHDLRR